MRIDRVAVTRFRGLHDLELEFGAGLMVLEGPNEAGKSTLMAFIQALLFPTTLTATTRVTGSVDISVSGKRYRVSRSGARATQRLRDLDTGESLASAHLAALTGQLDASVYRSVFAFGLGELQSFEALTDAAVKERLYSAAVAGAGANAGRASRALDDELNGLLKPRSPATTLGQLAGELTSALNAAHAARREAANYASAVRERVSVAAEAEQRAVERAAAAERVGWFSALLDAWPNWQAGAAAGVDLASLEAEIAAYAAGTGAGPAPALWLAHAEDVKGLEARLAAFEQTAAEVETRQQELSQHVADLRTGLSALGPHWNPKRLADFVDSAGWRARAAAARTAIEEKTAALARLEGAKAEVELQVGLAAGREEAARDERERLLREPLLVRAFAQVEPEPANDDAAVDAALAQLAERTRERKAGMARVSDLFTELAEVRDARAQANEQLRVSAMRAAGWQRWVGWALVLCLALGAGWLGWRSDRAYLAAAAASVVATVLLWPRWRRSRVAAAALTELEERAAALRAEETDLTADLQSALAALGLKRDARSADVAAASRAALELDAALEAAARSGSDLDRAAREARDARAAFATHAGNATKLGEERTALLNAWAEWCRTAGVPADLPPEELPAFVADIERLQAVQSAFRDVDAKLRPAMARADYYRKQVGALAMALGLASEPEAAASTVRAWAARAKEVEARYLELEQKRLALQAAVVAAERDVAARFGARADQAREALAAGDPQGWQASLTLEQERERTLATAARRLNEQTGALTQKLAEAEASADLATQLQTAERVAAEARAQVRRWVVARLAKGLIDDTLEEYERTKVPEVLRRAGHHFGTMTAGRYVRVHLHEGRELRAFTPNDEVLAAADLSRGTFEQLYLAVRLGLIESFSAANVALPLVLDDVLANADPERAARLAAVLADLAERQQVLFLTCQPHIASLLVAQAPRAKHVVLPHRVGAALAFDDGSS